MNNKGTLIIAPIRPQFNGDTYPVAYAEEIRGGHHQVNNEASRLNISSDRLKDGMLVSVFSTNRTYQYSGGTWIELNFEFLQNIDLSSSTISNNQILTYDSNSGKWTNKNLIGFGLYETGTTTLYSGTTTDVIIGTKLEDRGMTIDYTLFRSGNTNQYQIGCLYIIHDNVNVKISDEYVTTGDFKIVEFNANFDGFNEDLINLNCVVDNSGENTIMNYHLKKIKF